LNKGNVGLPPQYPAECGWIKTPLFQGTDKAHRGDPQVPTWQHPRGVPRLGYVDDREKIVYLDKEAAIPLANRIALLSGDTAPFTSHDVGRNLIHEKLCRLPKGKPRASTNRRIEGVKRHYLELPRDLVMPPEQRVQAGDSLSCLTGAQFSTEGLGVSD